MHKVDTAELRKAMVDAGFDTIESLSEASGVNRTTVANVVKGRTYPSSMVMEKLKIALKLSGEHAGAIFFKEILADDASANVNCKEV